MPSLMLLLDIPETISQLSISTSASDLVPLLKSVKNSLIGDKLKKEEWVQAGVLLILNDIVRNSQVHSRNTPDVLSDADHVIIQSNLILTSLASAGVEFLDPIYHSGIVASISRCVRPKSQHPQVILSALRALESVADTISYTAHDDTFTQKAFSDIIFEMISTESFRELLLLVDAPENYLLANSALTILTCLDLSEERRLNMAKAGLLDALATRLASNVISQNFNPLVSEEFCREKEIEEYLPEPESRVNLSSILEAAAHLIGNCKLLACMFVFSPSIIATFTDDPESTYDSGNVLSSLKQHAENLLPVISDESIKMLSKPIVHVSIMPRPMTDVLDELEESKLYEVVKRSPFLECLMSMFRKTDSTRERLALAGLLAICLQTGCLVQKRLVVSIAILVLPGILRLLEATRDEAKNMKFTSNSVSRFKPYWYVIETAIQVLGRTFRDNNIMGRIISLARVPQVLYSLLEYAYLPCVVTEQKRWSPNPDVKNKMDIDSKPPGCVLGPRGQSPLMVHHLRVRQYTITAIASLAGEGDDYRCIFTEELPVIPLFSESLYKFPYKPVTRDRVVDRIDDSKRVYNPQYGVNPPAVIEAACHGIRIMARSIPALRTTMVDFKIHRPIAALLKSEDPKLVNASAHALCNLTIEASPLRNSLIEQFNIVTPLAELTHAPDPELRLNAIWALKAIVDYASIRTKMQALNGIEPKWLVKLITEDMETDALVASQLYQDDEMNTDQHDADVLQEETYLLYTAPVALGGLGGTENELFAKYEKKLKVITSEDMNPGRRARVLDSGIQEVSLNFIRNLLGLLPSEDGPMNHSKSAIIGMNVINHTLEVIGVDEFFDMLKSKLRQRYTAVPSPESAVSAAFKTQLWYPQSSIVTAVFYIIGHLAAKDAQYRNMIMEQDILPLCIQYMDSPNPEACTALCRLLYNLLGADEAQEPLHVLKQRVNLIVEMGYMDKLSQLIQVINAADVREAAMLARSLLRKLMERTPNE